MKQFMKMVEKVESYIDDLIRICCNLYLELKMIKSENPEDYTEDQFEEFKQMAEDDKEEIVNIVYCIFEECGIRPFEKSNGNSFLGSANAADYTCMGPDITDEEINETYIKDWTDEICESLANILFCMKNI